MSSDDDQGRGAPLYDALWSLSGMTTRHQLREEPAMADYGHAHAQYDEPHPHAEAYGLGAGHVYGSDDQPGGPPAPPLGQAGPHISGEYSTGNSGQRIDARDLQPLTDPTALTPCPTCGTGVHPDRIR